MPCDKSNADNINTVLSLINTEKTVSAKYKHYSLAAKELGIKDLCENFAQRHTACHNMLMQYLEGEKENCNA